LNVGVWATVVLVVEVEMTMVVGGEVVVVVIVVVVGGLLVVVGGGVVLLGVIAFWHPMIEVIKAKLTTTRGKPE
jgi:hypothetical protein